jgi:mycothiol synthase
VPPELTLRPPTLDDIAAIAALLNRVAEADQGGWVDERAVRRWFTSPQFAVEDDAVVAERDAELVAYGDVYRAGDAREKVWADLRVPTEERGGEVLSALVDWAELQGGGARLRFTFPELNTPLRRELERRGFAPVRYSFEMEIALEEEPPEPEWPEGIRVRTFREGDERRIYEANMEAFADHWDFTPEPFDAWQHGHTKDGFEPGCWFVAEDEGEIAGICLCRSRRVADSELGWVDELGVRKPWRRRGLGLALLRHSFRELRALGRGGAGLGVDGENTTGAVRLYERAGMHVARRADTYERPAPS